MAVSFSKSSGINSGKTRNVIGSINYGNNSVNINYVSAIFTGGTETTISGIKYSVFKTSTNITVTSGGFVEALIVGGGGGGGAFTGGGGGGGGVILWQKIYLASGTKVITVGALGAASVYPGTGYGSAGGNSSVESLIAYGGGGGSYRIYDSGRSASGLTQPPTSPADGGWGGSGGGTNSGGGSSGQGIAGQGGDGGKPSINGGGGGGYSGSAGTNNTGVNGYNATSTFASIDASITWVGSGGGGGADNGVSYSGGTLGGNGNQTTGGGASGFGNGGGAGGYIPMPTNAAYAGGAGTAGLVVIRRSI